MLKNDSSDSNHSLTFTVLVFAAFTEKEERERQRQQAKETHNLLLTIVVFVCESYSFYDSCIHQFMENRNQQHHAYFLTWVG